MSEEWPRWVMVNGKRFKRIHRGSWGAVYSRGKWLIEASTASDDRLDKFLVDLSLPCKAVGAEPDIRIWGNGKTLGSALKSLERRMAQVARFSKGDGS